MQQSWGMGSQNGQSDPPMTHVFMISFPGQGHINPLLRLGKRLASKGLLVTFSTTATSGQAIRRANDAISDEPVPVGDGFIRFEFIEDGWPEHDPRRKHLDQYLPHLESVGRERVPEMLARQAREGRPVSCLINNLFLPWVSDVADDQGLPSALMWVHSCASFLAYYYCSHSLVPFPDENAPDIDVQIPSMPLLKWDEIPSFLHPTMPYVRQRRAILEQFQNLSKAFCVLIDTFYDLEPEMVDHINTLCGPIRPVGPLFKDPKPVAGSSRVRADLMMADRECIGWLDRKPAGSVVYISFGTVVHLKQEQVDEIAAALAAVGVPFLWVMKPPHPDKGLTPNKLPEGFLEKAGDNGKVVEFSPQEQVLAHPALACTMTHCGWNSTMEALASGVPVVALPQYSDQVTNAKFLCDVFGVGLRLCRSGHGNRIIPKEEVEKCLREATSAAEFKKNALKWKAAAERAVAEGGSSEQNLQAFVDEIRKRSKIMFGDIDANN